MSPRGGCYPGVIVTQGWLLPRGGCYPGVVVTQGWLLPRGGCYPGVVVGGGGGCAGIITILSGAIIIHVHFDSGCLDLLHTPASCAFWYASGFAVVSGIF